MTLVLSLFPGIGLLDMAFEEEGFCVVRGPDLLWGGDIRAFHPPAGKFDGVIGGPPCQLFSVVKYFNPHVGKKHGNMIPEFERCVALARPEWFLMENVPEAPSSTVEGYRVQRVLYDNLWAGGISARRRAFCFGTRDGRRIVPVEMVLGEEQSPLPTATAGHSPIAKGREYKGNDTPADRAVAQGLPADFLAEAPFTVNHKKMVIGNGVPLPMGRAIARAVKRATLKDVV